MAHAFRAFRPVMRPVMRPVVRRMRTLCIDIGVVALLVVSGVVAAPAAQAHEAESMPHVTIFAHNNASRTRFFYTMSTRAVPAGFVRFTLDNVSAGDHMAQFIKLKSGVSERLIVSELTELFALPPGPKTAAEFKELLTLATPAGGANSIGPGERQDVIEHLTPGRYVIVCFDTTAKGVPHFELGMHITFQVTHRVQDDDAPSANGTVIERDHQILLPAVIHESETLRLRVTVRDQTHELGLVKLPDGTTRAQLLACLSGQTCTIAAPPEDAGGTGAIAPGLTQWVILHLQPGTYGAVCFVPDIHTGLPHALMGMVTVFTVTK